MAGHEEDVGDSAGGATLRLEQESGPKLRPPARSRSEVATTIQLARSDSAPGAVDPSPTSFGTSDRERYEVRKSLGEGGMGEVLLCKDGWIGREVAKKVAHKSSGSRPAARSRFLREVRVQGQLEHPGIVPVYDLGRDSAGSTYFTMKRINGYTLEEIVAALRSGDPAAREQYSRRKLLGAMSQVCLTVAFAHSRGVVHRDLKPANVMLGDFGEVYVLDWGVAKVLDVPDDESVEDAVDASGGGRTEAGALLGTPGYMAPEQVRGEVVDTRADVYALGAILFELLALQPLHSARSLEALLTSTLTAGPGSPAGRAPELDVPPELDAICRRATEPAPDDRYQSARDLHDAIERFLDGERDLERRRELAGAHARAARDALDSAARPGAGSEHERARAMRELGAALALDPTNEQALETMVEVLVRPSDELAPEAEAELTAVVYRDRARAARRTMVALLCWYLGTPLLLWMGVRNWWLLLALDLLLVVLIGYEWWMARTGSVQPKYMRWAIPMAFANIAGLSVFLGPFVVVPAVATAACAAFMVGLRANRLTRYFIAACATGAVFVPAGLQAARLLPASYAFEGGVIRVLPLATGLPPTATAVFMVLTTVLTLMTCAVLVGRAASTLIEAERRVFGQAFRLRQLLPEAARLRSVPPPASDPRCELSARW